MGFTISKQDAAGKTSMKLCVCACVRACVSVCEGGGGLATKSLIGHHFADIVKYILYVIKMIIICFQFHWSPIADGLVPIRQQAIAWIHSNFIIWQHGSNKMENIKHAEHNGDLIPCGWVIAS